MQLIPLSCIIKVLYCSGNISIIFLCFSSHAIDLHKSLAMGNVALLSYQNLCHTASVLGVEFWSVVFLGFL